MKPTTEKESPPVYSIYGLTHPESKKVRYIGMSKKPEERYKQHLRNAADWIQELLQRGLEPGQIILESGLSLEEAKEREKYWIGRAEAAGHPLENWIHNEHSHRERAEAKEEEEEFARRFSHLSENDARLMVQLTKLGRSKAGFCAWETTYEILRFAAIQIAESAGIPPISEIDTAKMTFRYFQDTWEEVGAA